MDQKGLKTFQGLMHLGAVMSHKEVKITQGWILLFKNSLRDIVKQSN